MCVLLSIFKVKYRVHVIYVGISEIRTNENITIDTMIKFIACNHPEWSKFIQYICMTLNSKQCVYSFIFKVNYQVHVINPEISEILTIENITIDIKIKFIACNQPERNKVIQ